MWRGLMLNRGVQHFLQDVAWGDDLDYLLIDMPPGTGDVQMGVSKLLPRAEVLIVTTPAVAAQKVAIRAVNMARKSYLRVAGVIENMSAFTCDHGTDYALFGEGGGQTLADDAGIPLLGQVPLEPAVSAGGDSGEPIALGVGPGGRGVPGHRRAASSTRRCRPPRWRGAAPACSRPPSPRSTKRTLLPVDREVLVVLLGRPAAAPLPVRRSRTRRRAGCPRRPCRGRRRCGSPTARCRAGCRCR